MTSSASSPGSDSSTGVVFTPAGSSSPLPPSAPSTQNPTNPIRLASLPENVKEDLSAEKQQLRDDQEDDSGDESEVSDMSGRPPLRRPSGGLSQSNRPLLREDKHVRGRSDDSFSTRRAAFRSRSPKHSDPEKVTRRKYMYAAFFLMVSLVSFVVQTETAVYIQHKLHWDKAYCMLWLTHGSWSTLWFIQLAFLRLQQRKLSWSAFWRKHLDIVRTTAQMVKSQDLHISPTTSAGNPWPFLIKTTAGITTFLTMAGGSWYVAVNMTTPSDLTAIYNCSAFFAYVFSIILLKDKVRLDKVVSVAMAIVGVLIVAYGDSSHPKHGSHSGGSTNPDPGDEFPNRTMGNLMIFIGSVMYGLYEVLYKKYACPPDGVSPHRGMIFANTFGSMIGFFTLCVLWIPIPFLHILGIERFELPRGKAAAMLAVSTLSNAIFSGAFLVLMSLTSPVLSSVAALLTIFLVALTDWWLTGQPISAAALTGGMIIIVAFLLLSWATYREMTEEERKREIEHDKSFDIRDVEGDFDLDLDEDDEDMDELGRSRRNSERL